MSREKLVLIIWKKIVYFNQKKSVEKIFKNSKKFIASLSTVAFLLVFGWQFGISGSNVPFSEKEVALENALAGSNTPDLCWDTITTQQGSMVFYCATCSWIPDSTDSFWSHQRTTCSGG